ncbi:hypothetical protein SPAR120_0475 [Streptococcus pneumoniae GA47901]|nr:hypothetical protein SPAR120_0475 [Streptococcus pneumoniae GA47901]
MYNQIDTLPFANLFQIFLTINKNFEYLYFFITKLLFKYINFILTNIIS